MIETDAALDRAFAALADPVRRAIVARLSRGSATLGELAEPFDISQPAVSKHLKMLERAGLITRGRHAQRRPARLEGRPLEAAHRWLERFREVWETNFARLDSVLEDLQKARKSRPQTKSGRRVRN